MKRIFCLAVTALALGLMINSTHAKATVCSNATVRGTYGVTIRGQIFLPDGSILVLNGLAKQTYDGNGNFAQVDAVAVNGVLSPPGWRPGTGTYSVNPDCTGTQTITIAGQPDLHIQFVVTQSGNTMRGMVADPGVATTAEGERVRAPKK